MSSSAEPFFLPKDSIIFLKDGYTCEKIKKERAIGNHFSTKEIDSIPFLVLENISFDNKHIMENLIDYFDNMPAETHACDENTIFVGVGDLDKILPMSI